MFLVRDPQAVAASFNREDVREYTKSTLHTNVYLWVTHLLSLFVFLRQPRDRRMFVRYEDFLRDPKGSCARSWTAPAPPTRRRPTSLSGDRPPFQGTG